MIGGRMNRHLNVFTRYERVDHHEDQLTRAAMIVLRLVPAAREALLRLIDGPGLSQLPTAGDVDMQTSDVIGQGDSQNELDELVSVFLVPDETREEMDSEVVPSERGQRLDGVLRFPPDLVVVIESKITEGADSWQAREMDFGGSPPKRSRTRNVYWHALLEAWWHLTDLGLLSPTEELLVQDLLDYADEHFPALLPFTTLRRARGHEGRIARRLRAIALLSTGFAPRDRTCFVKLDEHLGTTSVQRVELSMNDGELWLEMWPGESNQQAYHLYSDGRAQRVADLHGQDGWQVIANACLSFRNAHWTNRLYLDAWDLPIAKYVAQWSEDMDWIVQYDVNTLRDEVWPWLLSRGYAKATDDLDGFCARLGNRPAYLRPGIAIRRVWPLDVAEDLDDRGALVPEVHDAINQILTLLDEPQLPTRGSA
jgi:hypothetical protein